jgi:hypothetical protein
MRLSLLDLLPAPGAAHGDLAPRGVDAAPVPPVASPVAGGTPSARSWLLFLSPDDPMTCLSAYLVVHMEYGRGPDAERGALVPALGRSWKGQGHLWEVMHPLVVLLQQRVADDFGISPFSFLNLDPMNPASHGYIASTTAWAGESRDFIPGPFPADLLVSAGALHRIYLQHRDYPPASQPQPMDV